MKVDRVKATIRYSQDTGKGAWKSVEVGAESTVDTREDWQVAQASLYQQLGLQLKSLWASGNGKGQEATTEITTRPANPEPPPPTAHFCQEHQTEYKRYEKDGRVWFSHRVGNQWCREE